MRKTPPTTTAPSPSSPSAPTQQRRRPGPPPHGSGGGGGLLNSIYQCVDVRNYAKVLKLTSPASAPSSSINGNRGGGGVVDESSDERGWDVVRALRAHALERTGRRREALALLLEMLATTEGGTTTTAEERWRELRGRLASLTTAEAVVSAPPGGTTGGGLRIFDSVAALDAMAYSPVVPPPRPPAPAPAAGASSLPPLPPVTDATVLQTVCVTLRNEGLHGTMSDMYHAATESLTMSSPPPPGGIVRDEENFVNVLKDGMSAHLRATCDVPPTTTADTTSPIPVYSTHRNPAARRRESLRALLPKLDGAMALASYRERMQTCSLQLAKVTSEPLHYLWTSISGLWYQESLADLVEILVRARSLLSSSSSAAAAEEEEAEATTADDGAGASSSSAEEEDEEERILRESFRGVMASHSYPTDLDGIPSLLDKLRQKVAFLPRLAESLSSRVVVGPMQQRQQQASENDWDVYLEALLVQGKRSEALEALGGIRCAPVGGEEENDDLSSAPPLPRIEDETSVSERVGSMLPYTRRRKAERMARLSYESGLHDEAESYYRELLMSFPDQWTYWMGLVECSCFVARGGEGEGTSSCATSGGGRTVDEGGWQRCASFSRDVISGGGRGDHHELRGPHLVFLELIAVKLRHHEGMRDDSTAVATVNGDDRESLVTLLRDEIRKYGDRFGPVASCCYEDLRPYVRAIVRAASDTASSREQTAIGGQDDVPDDALHLLLWAKETWATNSQSNDGDEVNQNAIMPEKMEDSTDALLRDRRKRLRKYVFAVQVVFGISNEFEDKNIAMQLLRTYAPSLSHMVIEWRTSLSSLPGVAPKDGGQKEVLPGDEIVLLTSQYLLFEGASPEQHSSSDGSSAPFFLRAASLLEEAIDHSPYNPHLKIAAISVYSRLGAAERALAIYQDLGVRQIQLDSCSYLILPLLIKGGLYTAAIKIAASILRMHGSTSKDVKGYASDSLENGLMLKADEMVKFQREKMRPSLQLLHSKAVLMDAAPLMIPSEIGIDTVGGGARQRGAKLPSTVGLASEKGFCGSEGDLARAEQLVVDAEMHFNAPSIIHAAAQSATIDDFISSDNRDKTLNYFESLYRTSHLTQREMVVTSLRSGHSHGLMVRAVMAVGSASAPKKGKIPKSTEERSYRCQSLRHALSRAREFGREAALDEVDGALWDACCQLCEAIIVVIHGNCRADESSVDTLAEREVATTSFIDSTTQLVHSARTALSSCYSKVESSSDDHSSVMGARVCQLLPDYVVPFYVFLETTARLFSLFGWGKRKRLTKIASGALAKSALSLQHLISDMLQVISQYRSFGGKDVLSLAEGASGPEFRIEEVHRVIKEAISSREGTKDRVDSFLSQMKDSLDTFSNEQ